MGLDEIKRNLVTRLNQWSDLFELINKQKKKHNPKPTSVIKAPVLAEC